jgi:hypothetical protein
VSIALSALASAAVLAELPVLVEHETPASQDQRLSSTSFSSMSFGRFPQNGKGRRVSTSEQGLLRLRIIELRQVPASGSGMKGAPNHERRDWTRAAK